MITAPVLTVGQCLAGTILVGAPARVAIWSAGEGKPPPPSIVRLLGARTLVQGVVVARAGRSGRLDQKTALRLGSVVDLLHATSMVAVALARPAYRRSAAWSAGAAFLSAGLGAVAAR